MTSTIPGLAFIGTSRPSAQSQAVALSFVRSRKRKRLCTFIRSLQAEDKKAAQSSTSEATVLSEIKGKERRTYSFNHQNQLVLEQQGSSNRQQGSSSLLTGFKGFVLPKGYPEAVTPDYLAFQLWAVPAHITGWMGTSLATSSLLKAVGLANSAEGAAAAGAAIKWISKDGIGAAGRSLVGGRLGDVFDEDPRRWRMVAEAFLTLGLALEIATAFSPTNFVLLAGAGNLSKAAGRGMTNPCFRIIQTHFAVANNIGDVAAKEEVWEVTAQLIGLAGSVVLLKAIEATGKPENVLYVWAVNQVAHAWLRYKSLAVLQFDSINQKRACLLARASVKGHKLPGVPDGNQRESVLAWPSLARPSLTFASSLEDMLGSSATLLGAQALCDTYADSRYLLSWESSRGKLLMEEASSAEDVLLAVWQAAWLDVRGIVNATRTDLQASLEALRRQGPVFTKELRAAGWQVDNVTIRLGPVRYQRHRRNGR
ncbi:hypothetical protein CVIRNUC_010118 [Coccomyxa viridis]|uniref:Uncharacterized protein n=1 Tax=Coccomyxa viridis TaxID=1274662 RepID=A0AAV1ILS3_9CHLO|nr:hypothetical protein CVIRNUC_010118 [Coccomyxa viridis]